MHKRRGSIKTGRALSLARFVVGLSAIVQLRQRQFVLAVICGRRDRDGRVKLSAEAPRAVSAVMGLFRLVEVRVSRFIHK